MIMQKSIDDYGEWGSVPSVVPSTVTVDPASTATPTQQAQAESSALQAIATASTLPPPPLIAPIADSTGLIGREWAIWFRKQWVMGGGMVPVSTVDLEVVDAYATDQTRVHAVDEEVEFQSDLGGQLADLRKRLDELAFMLESLPAKAPDSARLGGISASSFPTGTIPVKTVSTPIINGVAAIGAEGKWADGLHVHPVDTSRLAAGATAANSSQLLGATWASPAVIGSITPNSGSFTDGYFSASANAPTFQTSTTSAGAAGAIFFNSYWGLTARAKTGTAFDFALLNAAASGYTMTVGVGGTTPDFPNGLTVSGLVQVAGSTGNTVKYSAGTANAAVATTMGSVGPTGSTAGNPLGWLRVNVAGVDRFVPYW